MFEILIRRAYLTAIVVLSVVVFAGCASGPKPRLFDGGILTATDLNPDQSGRPSPVILRIYQLREKDNFQNANFFALYDKGDVLLGKDLVAMEEKEMLPAMNTPYQIEINPDTAYVGVLVAYRDVDNAGWHAFTDIPEKKIFGGFNRPVIQIKLEKLNVSVEFKKL